MTAPPRAPSNLTFHRELQGGKSTIVVSWAPPTAGQPVPTGSTVTGSGCGTLQSSNFAGARFINVPASKTTCTAGAAAGRRGPPPGTARRRPRARDAPPGPAPAHAADVLLDGLAIRQLEGHTAAAPALARALQGILALNAGTDIEVGRWLWLAGLRAAGLVANELWDDDARHTLAVRQVEVARSAGALVQLQYALNFLAWTSLDAGEVAVARGYSTRTA